MIFEDGAGALGHILDDESEMTGVVGTGKTLFECGDKLIKGRELSCGAVFHHEPEFGSVRKKGCGSFHLLYFISRCSNMCTDLEDLGADCSEGRVFSHEEQGFHLFQCRRCHDGVLRGRIE